MIIRRILAAVIDFSIFGSGIILTYYSVTKGRSVSKIWDGAFPLIILIVWIAYIIFLSFLLLNWRGQTIGYSFMRLRLISKRNEDLTLWQILVRSFIFASLCGPSWIYIPFVSLGIFVSASYLAFLKQNRSLKQLVWDLVAGTVVVFVNRESSESPI
jgi:uncharacterized RDD family membrane protein YckC